MLLIWLFLLLYCRALRFADRDNTHQLFEYVFLESECENGLFNVHEFVPNVSFGSLSFGQAIQCIGRSGYRSLPLTTSYAFISNRTFASVYDRIAQTKEFSVEMWLKVEDQSYIISQLLSVAQVTSASFDNKDVFSIQHFYDNILFFLSGTASGSVSLVLYSVDSEPYVHVVASVRFRQSGTDMYSYKNGSSLITRTVSPTYYDLWNPQNRLYGSLARSGGPFIPRWNGEVYYLGFFDHILNETQIAHNFNCSVPPSLPSLEPRYVHGLMNNRFRIDIPVHDYNLNSHTNLIPGYSITVKLMSLPHRGQLYSHSSSPLTSLPSSGLILTNTTLFYQAPVDEFSDTPYTNITLILSNPYGVSNLKTLQIYVDWLNHAPIVHNASYSFSTDSIHHTLLVIDDEDEDKAYTRILNVSPRCSIVNLPSTGIIQSFDFSVEYLGDKQLNQSSDTCMIRLVVGDTRNLESEEAVITYTIFNTLIPSSLILHANETIESHFEIVIQNTTSILPIEEMSFELIEKPVHGIINDSYPFVFVSESLYFSDPETDINGNNLNMKNDSLLLCVIHKGIRSSVFNFTIVIHHVNTEPILQTPVSIPFKLYQPTLLTNISITDYDRDTQLGILRLETVTSFFFVNTSMSDPTNPVRWIKGNYGENMDDTMSELEGSLSALHAILQSITFRGIYKLNDTLVITLIDGDFVVQRRVLLEYIAEKEPIVTSRFWIIIGVIGVIIVIWVVWILVRLCSFCCCCCSKKKKQLPLQKSKELEMTTHPTIGVSSKSHETVANRSKSITEEHLSESSTLAKRSIRPSTEQSINHPVPPVTKKIPPQIPTSPLPVSKKTPPRVPTSPLPVSKKTPPLVPTSPLPMPKKMPPPLPNSLPPELPPISRNTVRPSVGAPK